MRLRTVKGIARFKNVSSRNIKWEGASKSKFQRKVKVLVHPLWKNHVVYEEFPVYGTRYTIDFFNATKKVAIEVQGRQHTKFVKYFHGSQFQYLEQLKIDETKRRFCDINGITLIEIFEEDIDELSPEFMTKLGL